MTYSKFSTFFLTLALCFQASSAAFAQEPAPQGDAQGAPAQADSQPAPQAEAPAAKKQPSDPGDVIANYFDSMYDIVTENIDTPQMLVERFASYIKDNEKQMRNASRAFENKMTSLKPSEAEAYRESVQRKITPALERLITQLIDFSTKYPDEAKKLDSVLKVDAKYAYEQ